MNNLNKFLEAARKRPEIGMITTTYIPSTPQKFVNVDKEKVLKQGVNAQDVYDTLQTFMGGQFVNYFNNSAAPGRCMWKPKRPTAPTWTTWDSSTSATCSGEMVPLSALTRFESRYGPEFKMRFNKYSVGADYRQRRAGLQLGAGHGGAGRGLPPDRCRRRWVFDYMGMSRQEQKAREGLPSWVIFAVSLLFVFLILAALYESWSLPFSVLLSTPVAVFGAFGLLWLRRTVLGMIFPAFMVQIDNDVYSQIGLVMLIGLAAQERHPDRRICQGATRRKASPWSTRHCEGAKLRLRPILMTSFAFVLGCVPLFIATGAGSVGRQIMGTTVIGGMLAATGIAIFIIPALYVIVERVAGIGQASRSSMLLQRSRTGLRWKGTNVKKI